MEKHFSQAVITFLDVLGWKGIWQRQKNAIATLESLVKSIDDNKNELVRGKTFLLSNSKPDSTNIIVISDTIVLVTEVDEDYIGDAIDLHGKLCSKAIPLSIKKGIPIRGATSYGEVIISQENSIFAGKAIDEAASWHETANWIGVFMTPSANFIYNDKQTEEKFWNKYNPPLKNNILLGTYCVNWNADVFSIKKDFTQLAPILPEIVEKFTNTIKYLENKTP